MRPTTNSPGDDGGRYINTTTIIYYDDNCGLCRAFKGKIEKCAPGRFAFRRLKTLERDRRGGIPPGRFESLVMIDSKAGVLTGHEAVAGIAIRLNSNYRLFGRMLLVRPISNMAGLIYRLVSANRNRLSAFFKIGAK